MRLRVFLMMLLYLCAFPFLSAAQADRRVALVIGNSTYAYAPKLENPKNDAADISAALGLLGFQVIEGVDLNKVEFERKIRAFSDKLTDADVGVFFYAGHGLQVEGQNYLVPVDAQLSTPSALDFEMVRLDLVHRTMERSAKTNIIFLDACRDNPLARNLARAMGTRSIAIGRGLAAVESGLGTLISFSTQPGNVALDGAGRNSPFAGAILKHIIGTNDDLSALLIAVRNDVIAETNGKQVPWEHSALTGKFYFNAALAPATQATPSDTQAWMDFQAAARIGTKDAWDVFIAAHSKGFYADLARAQRAKLTAIPKEPKSPASEKPKPNLKAALPSDEDKPKKRTPTNWDCCLAYYEGEISVEGRGPPERCRVNIEQGLGPFCKLLKENYPTRYMALES